MKEQKDYNKAKEKKVTSRKDQVTLAQIRSGKHKAFQQYQNFLDKTILASCPLCAGEEYSLKHWMTQCPRTLQARTEIFGDEEEGG